MTDLYLKDPAPGPPWAPFCDSRPVSELRAGAWLIRERWEAIAGGQTLAVFASQPLHGFTEEGAAPVRPMTQVDGPAIVGRSDFAPTGVAPDLPQEPARLVNDDTTVGWWIAEGAQWADGTYDDWRAVELAGLPLHGAYDLLTALEHFLVADVADFVHEQGEGLPEGSIVIGDPDDVITLGARVEPGVLFDVREGAIVLEQHSYVRSGTRFEGPVYVGPGTEVLGGPVRASAFGPQCRVRGEIANSVFLGYANKAHDGFVGHSVIGRWANLGANTVTSNLKNTYGHVRLRVGPDVLETHRQFMGSLIGDHAKTAIGTLLDTGTIIGAGANVFGSVRPPKYVPPFAWGTDGAVMNEEGFLTVASRVMPRRQVTVSDEVQEMLRAIYRAATST